MPRKPRISGNNKPGSGGSSTPAAPASPPKQFTKSKGGADHGKKFIVYGGSGMGKSSLSILAPKPILIPLDDGTANIRDPYTGEKIEQVNGVITFADTRAVLQQPDLFADNETVIVDTVTKLEDLSHQYMFETIPHEKGGTVKSIEGYGFGKGYRHLYDTMKLFLQDVDAVVRTGKNVILIAQCTTRNIPNAAGEDYLCYCPRLYPGSKGTPSVEELYREWADHVLYIDYTSTIVKDKKASGDTTRAIFTQSELHFKAKSRVLESGEPIPAVVSFNDLSDDSIFQYIFPELGENDDADDKPAVPHNTPPIP
jgi:hypothetical protein